MIGWMLPCLRARGVRIDGVHIGQDDLPVADARRLLGEHAIIGLTTGTRELVERANAVAHLIDYIGAGPFRPSPTKASNRPPLGVEGLRELAELSKVPVVAIGDIWPQDCPSIRETGVAGGCNGTRLRGKPGIAGIIMAEVITVVGGGVIWAGNRL